MVASSNGYEDHERLHEENAHLRARLKAALSVVDAVKDLMSQSTRTFFIRMIPDSCWDNLIHAMIEWEKAHEASST